jgi:uncharacterized protein (TIGR00288 family)
MELRIDQSVAILIDGNNIERSLHHVTGIENSLINFDSLIPKLVKERGLNRLVYFKEGRYISDKLAERLHNQFYGRVVPCHKTADIPLTITATQLADKVDSIIIMSGDSDFVELVEHLKSRGVRVEIAAVAKTTSRLLIEAADHFTPIEKEDAYELKLPKKNYMQQNEQYSPSGAESTEESNETKGE